MTDDALNNIALGHLAASIQKAFGDAILAQSCGDDLYLKIGPKAAWFNTSGRIVGESFDGVGGLEVGVDKNGVVAAPAGVAAVS